MPRGDRTGPFGQGPRAGRAAGYCAGYGAPGYMNLAPGLGYGIGRGQGMGFGRGRGGFRGRGFRRFCNWGYPYYDPAYGPVPGPNAYYNPPSPSPQEEKAYLLSETKILQDQLSMLEKRIAELEAAEKNED